MNKIKTINIFVAVYYIGDHVRRSYNGSRASIFAFQSHKSIKANIFGGYEILRWRQKIHSTNTANTSTDFRYAGTTALFYYDVHSSRLLHVLRN